MPRLDQLLASLGYGSRREVRAAIEEGRVSAGGTRSTDPGQKVQPDEVRWDGEALDHPAGLLLVLHKPLGVVCSHDPREGANVYDLLPERWRRRNPPVTSVGRLDKETSGLLLLTDRSALVHRLTSPRHKVPKVYRASLDRDVPESAAERWAAGGWSLPGESEPCAPALLRQVAPREAEVTLTEGRYHQVRRMFAAEGCSVLALHRSAFGTLTLDGLAPGRWRELPLATFG
jgi:16S rRNA pseudouridine516 synthase